MQEFLSKAKNIWCIDSGSSRHTVWDKSLLSCRIDLLDNEVFFADSKGGLYTYIGDFIDGDIILERVKCVELLDQEDEYLSDECFSYL